jgi:hypothetical protein
LGLGATDAGWLCVIVLGVIVLAISRPSRGEGYVVRTVEVGSILIGLLMVGAGIVGLVL